MEVCRSYDPGFAVCGALRCMVLFMALVGRDLCGELATHLCRYTSSMILSTKTKYMSK